MKVLLSIEFYDFDDKESAAGLAVIKECAVNDVLYGALDTAFAMNDVDAAITSIEVVQCFGKDEDAR